MTVTLKDNKNALDAVIAGLDAEYGLTPLDVSGEERIISKESAAFMTDSGRLALIRWGADEKERFLPIVKIYGESLITLLPESLNSNYVPFKISVPASLRSDEAKKPG